MGDLAHKRKRPQGQSTVMSRSRRQDLTSGSTTAPATSDFLSMADRVNVSAPSCRPGHQSPGRDHLPELQRYARQRGRRADHWLGYDENLSPKVSHLTPRPTRKRPARTSRSRRSRSDATALRLELRRVRKFGTRMVMKPPEGSYRPQDGHARPRGPSRKPPHYLTVVANMPIQTRSGHRNRKAGQMIYAKRQELHRTGRRNSESQLEVLAAGTRCKTPHSLSICRQIPLS